MKFSPKLYWLTFAHGLIYVVTGTWPLIHIESFVWITGPKYDIWLVKVVGALLAAVGFVIFIAGQNKRITTEIMLLAVLVPLVLTIIDIYYVSIDRIWPVYLLDMLLEVALITCWMAFWLKNPIIQ